MVSIEIWALLIAIIGIIVPVAMTVYLALGTRAREAEKTNYERRITELEEGKKSGSFRIDNLQTQLHANDITTERLRGSLTNLEQKHDRLDDRLDDIQKTMVTKELFSQLQSAVNEVLRQGSLRRGESGRYPNPETSQSPFPGRPTR